MKGGMILLGVAGIGVLGFLGYKLIVRSSQTTNGNAPLVPAGSTTYSNSGTNSQPQPRVDNANQPWFGNGTIPVDQGAYDMKNVASYLDSGSSIIHSLQDIWGDAGSWFSDDNSIEISEMDWDQGYTWDANDTGMGELEVGPGYEYETSYA